MVQPGILGPKDDNDDRTIEDGVYRTYDVLSEEEYQAAMDKLTRENQMLPDDDPQKFIAKMGAEAIYDLLTVRR